MKNDEKQITWLLQGDPSIRYQTLRDLVHADEKVIARERENILKEGWGRQLMELQQANGTWCDALYSPKWTSTFYTVLLLKRMGAGHHPRIENACRILLDKGFYKDGGINYWKTWKQGESCVTGMLLSMLCHFGIKDDRLLSMIDYLISQQMPDQGWNCERYRGARHSSFHTTISVLEGLWEAERFFSDPGLVHSLREKQTQGIEFLLDHHLYKSNTTWKPVDPKMTKLAFPPRWHFDIMRGLDYFQEKEIPKDPRMNDAIELLLKKQTPEGVWKLEQKYPGKIFLDLEKTGQKSRWNTLRALRILQWWQNSRTRSDTRKGKKSFKVKKIRLGQDVNIDRDKLYLERGL